MWRGGDKTKRHQKETDKWTRERKREREREKALGRFLVRMQNQRQRRAPAAAETAQVKGQSWKRGYKVSSSRIDLCFIAVKWKWNM